VPGRGSGACAHDRLQTPRVPIRFSLLTLAFVGALWAGDVSAHDPGAWGGLFRTRDAGVTWQHLTPISFGSGALAVAVSPVDANHLLLATDSGVSRSRNGGRDWEIETPEVLIGSAFAAAFDVDGEHALVAGASAIFRTDGTGWQRVEAPAGSAPARALVSGAARGRVYLAGRTGLYRSDDWGQSWIDVGSEFQAERASALVVPSGRPDQVYVVAGGRVWVSADAARSWQLRSHGLPSGSMETVGLDPADANRLWAVGAGQVFRTDDQGQRWQPVGQPLPERPVVARAVAVSSRVILIATDRGVYRSPDDGERWELASENLPAHLEAPVLALDPRSPTTLYAGFALMPYDEWSRRAVEGGRPFGRLALANLAGGVAFLALLFLGASVVVQRLARTYYRTPSDRSGASTVSRTRRSGHVAR
jgi:photosystem II stability/assembly factor-like uncharacterized protein